MSKFVVHKHEAYKAGTHYDLRLEIGNHLESYACRKGIPLKPKIRRLLIKQPDHKKYWLTFEGEIPKGEYGGGKLTIYDSGDYKILKQDKNVRILQFNGHKIKGNYVLIKLGSSKDSYLIFKTS